MRSDQGEVRDQRHADLARFGKDVLGDLERDQQGLRPADDDDRDQNDRQDLAQPILRRIPPASAEETPATPTRPSPAEPALNSGIASRLLHCPMSPTARQATFGQFVAADDRR